LKRLVRLAAGKCLVARDSHPALLLISFARQGRLQFRLLTWGNKERVLLRVFDDLFGHHFALKASERALD
jgi:hypothetical protein